ncbi:MAG: serine hydroxymethyltransferase [Spirochaetaceae bacterium]|nr:serine hydroxymethyltransferase [Spirochaetaceae bacterium]RKX72939.1 MAG: serine hydroxymethyltransferase [Spirochaetota bacterium]RKX87481.1 MAG: serine hydroxymethyltransferase [Spirochaetota bacterium]RKX95983.1 MAG: serine hydroxymethyltransferase [Spirochaetota bacterium]
MPDNRTIAEVDPELHAAMTDELSRQRDRLELIASENLVSRAVLEAAGSVLTNKYAEGYPSKRYYGGCEFVDVAENLAIERAKKLFGAEFANVQPHAGSQANMSAYRAVMNHGDTLLGMNLAHGGHLTHGSPVSFSGKDYNIVSYGVSKETETIDYDELRKLALEHKPRIIVAGASAYPRILDFKKFRAIADESGALLITDMAHIAGLVAAGEHPSPLQYSHITTTTTHKTLRGPRGGMILVGKDIENDMGIVAPKSGRTKRIGEIINSVIFPGTQGGPLMHIIAAKAVALKEALQPDFKVYQKQVKENALTLARALIDGGVRLVSGGTDNHLMLVDLGPLDVTGKDAETWLDIAGMTVNKNAIPFDPKPPRISSGIRVGTPAITSRGLKTGEMSEVAGYMIDALKSGGDEGKLKSIAEKVKTLCDRFPVYPGL